VAHRIFPSKFHVDRKFYKGSQEKTLHLRPEFFLPSSLPH
jgi:hypothetical protein